MKKQQLRSEVIVEPLVERWHAWPYLLSPLSLGFWATGRLFPMLEQYLADPEAGHRAALAPSALGAWLPRVEPARAPELARLLDRMRSRWAAPLALANAYQHLVGQLAAEHQGDSMGELYRSLDPSLAGAVELHYDLGHHPRVQVKEALLFEERAALRASQSISLSVAPAGDRLPAFSTPRLSPPESVELSLPFDSPALDALAMARVRPVEVHALAEQLGVRPEQRRMFEGFFTDEHPPAPRYAGSGVRVRYFNHACVLLESAATTVLTDPWLAYAPPGANDRLSIADLPERIDYVVITHSHADHLVFETLLALRPRIGTVVVPRAAGNPVDPSLRRMLVDQGFRKVVEVEDLDRINFEDGAITALPFLGEHGELPFTGKSTYRVELAGRHFFIGADANGIDVEAYRRSRLDHPPIDLAFLGMECEGAPVTWMYEPFLERPLPLAAANSRRLDGCNSGRAELLLSALDARAVLVYALGTEPWLRYISSISFSPTSPPILEADRLIARFQARGLAADRLHGSAELQLDSA